MKTILIYLAGATSGLLMFGGAAVADHMHLSDTCTPTGAVRPWVTWHNIARDGSVQTITKEVTRCEEGGRMVTKRISGWE